MDRSILSRGYTQCRYGALHYMLVKPQGPVAGPPLVLLHQNPSSTFEYEKMAIEMAKDRLVIAFDTPGNGMSDAADAPPSMQEYAGAFAEGLDALALDVAGRFDVFGYHTGTYLAAELAIARPDLIGRVILSGMPFRPADQRAERLEAALKPVELTEDGAAIFDFLRVQWAWNVAGRDPRVPIEHAVMQFAERIKPMHRGGWPYIAVWSYDAEDRLPRITQPVLVLQPHEPLLEHSRNAAALIPGARFVEMPDLNKDVFQLGVERFAGEIRAWDAAGVIRRAYVDSRYGQLHYRIARPTGAATKPPLLMLHQTPRSGLEWEPVMPALARDRIVLAPDTPGYGASDPPPEPVTIEDFAEVMIGFLDDLVAAGEIPPGPVDVMGYHTGSVTTTQLAAAFPDRVRRIVVFGLAAYDAESRAAKLGKVDIFPVPKASDLSHVTRLWDLMGSMTDARATPAWRHAALADSLTTGARLPWGFIAVYRFDFHAAMAQVRQPALIINLDDDLNKVTAENAHRYAHGRVVEIPGAAHGVLALEAERLCALIGDFLDAESA